MEFHISHQEINVPTGKAGTAHPDQWSGLPCSGMGGQKDVWDGQDCITFLPDICLSRTKLQRGPKSRPVHVCKRSYQFRCVKEVTKKALVRKPDVIIYP